MEKEIKVITGIMLEIGLLYLFFYLIVGFSEWVMVSPDERLWLLLPTSLIIGAVFFVTGFTIYEKLIY